MLLELMSYLSYAFTLFRSHCSAERLEWQLNNYRVRMRFRADRLSLLPSGTSSNEALHAELNNWFRQHVRLHQDCNGL